MMRNETHERPRKLRFGYTTGACATACSLAAAQYLLRPKIPLKQITIQLPKGQSVTFLLEYCRLTSKGAIAATCKDAGDDPDVTHQAIIFVEIQLQARIGIEFQAGAGVGIITRKGLPIPVGEAAINPVPRQMIQQHLQQLAQQYHYTAGFKVIIGVENGVELAKKTLNARLGIIGGLSILGTTGIVRPFSCSAYIASIHRAIDVAQANQIEHIAACTGSGSEQMIQTHYQLSTMALIEMGDFVGAVLKYLKKVPIAKVSIVGGFGKISKFAAGHLDLHSRKSQIDLPFLAELAQADTVLQQVIEQCNTSIQVLQLCQQQHIELGNLVCQRALITAQKYLPAHIQVEVFAINRKNHLVGFATCCA
jgi:cobalt-precorrin-5B (C1)-methyltransferase